MKVACMEDLFLIKCCQSYCYSLPLLPQINAVKCNLTKLTTKKSWHSLGGQRLLVGSACAEHGFVVAFKRGGA